MYNTSNTSPPIHILYTKMVWGVMMECSNLFFLSTVACKLSECLSAKELAVLSADLVTLSDMLANILAHQDLCDNSSP